MQQVKNRRNDARTGSTFRRSGVGLALLIFLGTAQTASAAAIEVTSLVGLGANDLVDWSLHGPAIGSNPFTASSNAGVSVTTSEPSSVFVTLIQGSGWSGHFPGGTALIYTQGGGPVTFTFATPIEGFGMTLDISQNGSFTETIDRKSVV